MSQITSRPGTTIIPGTYVEILTGNSGGAVSSDGAGNINTVGTGNITIVGNPGTHTLTTELTGITQHSLQVGGAANALTQLGVATDGQLPIGSTGADPVLATLTAGTGISITNAAGSITIANTGSSTSVTTLHTQDGNNVTPTAGVINISGGNSLTTTGTVGPNTATISLTGITQYNVQTGGASNALNNVAPGATSGVPLISQGAASQPIFGTALVAGGGTGSTSFNTTGVVISGATSTTALAAVTLTDGQLAIGSSIGNPAAATLTAGTGIAITNGNNSISIATASGVATSFPADSGTATPASGVLDIFGDSHNITTTGSGHQVVVGLTGITQHSLQVGGASNALTQLGVATNGQLPIGSTGADPVLATITAGTGVTVTNGAGSITISAGGAGFSWTDATNASYTVVAENGYVADRGTLVTFTLPTNNSLGDTIKIVGKGAGGWKIVYGALQNIIFGSSASTVTTGNIASTNANDCVELVCTTASIAAPIFTVVSSVGNISIT